ncbi:PTS glucitol/sorbitol transporter subunit IIA [Planococcus sp. CP5-4]|uniref:PTS glucitol/sorbitol transporter subunit IIA n=1 Tax=unclassified Planococcus (in: firmicutes) TaxID=2662419 RepID=UPI001C232EAD|nr:MULTISPECIES: PTS glucitol/sorbitol transporter subunit IIA [unclassified Planococcus (in: firmicutes)]MBU9672708.1 PTS glucitol/sorbitol transporter subunit IIA [Planococcus sp. CP5-4_YE]MBV0908482.1 PTS glucitol/sorbitol transporter subunit IIA [Planococcus sp. CP5-4_UN]MBW6063249.1 PTS glucitol/sorbitol transporter subunit IIA [Planococcus sp. CP5-4]
MITKYEAKITEIGEEVDLFAEENMMVIFNNTVPEELRSFAVIHEQADLLEGVEVGDFLEINNERFEILFVGAKVNETLRDLGHCTIAFTGDATANLPGTMCVEKTPLPELALGAEIRILKA